MKYKIGSLIYLDFHSIVTNKRHKVFHIITGYEPIEEFYTFAPSIYISGSRFRIPSIIHDGIVFVID